MLADESATQTSQNQAALFFTNIWGVIRRPRSTIAGLVERRPVWQAFIVVFVAAILSGISRGLLTIGAIVEAFDLESGLARFALLGFHILVGLFTYVAPLALLAGCYWAMIRILGGRSSYLTLLLVASFLAVIFVISSLTRFAFFVAANISNVSAAGEYLLEISGNNVISVILVIWYVVLNTFMVRSASGLSTRRSIVVAAIPVILIAAVIIASFIGVGLNIVSRLT